MNAHKYSSDSTNLIAARSAVDACVPFLRAAPGLTVPFNGGTWNLRDKFGVITEVLFLTTLEVLYFRYLDADNRYRYYGNKFQINGESVLPLKLIKMQAPDIIGFRLSIGN